MPCCSLVLGPFYAIEFLWLRLVSRTVSSCYLFLFVVGKDVSIGSGKQHFRDVVAYG